MTSTLPNDGGPAFPIPDGMEYVRGWQPGVGDYNSVVQVAKGGMSLRTWLAGMALQGILAKEGPALEPDEQIGREAIENDVDRAFRYAEAMIRRQAR